MKNILYKKIILKFLSKNLFIVYVEYNIFSDFVIQRYEEYFI